MIFDFMALFVPLVVGSVFFAFGVGTLTTQSIFKKNGRKVSGRVRAIEKYQSTTTSGGERKTTTYYRPIVEYVYDGQERDVRGVGTNEMGYALNQSVSVLILDDPNSDKIQARIGGSRAHDIVGYAFLLCGLATTGFYFHEKGVSIVPVVVLSIAGFIGYKVAKMTCDFKLDFSSEHDGDYSKNSIIIESKADYQAEVSSHRFWGSLISYTFSFASLGLIYGGYKKLPADAEDMLMNDISGFLEIVTSGEMPSSWEAGAILLGFGLFMFLASLRSVYYVATKYKAGRL